MTINHQTDLDRATKNIRFWLGSGTRYLSEILVPGSCIVCEGAVAKQGGCCPKCWSKMRFVSEPLCPVMGIPFSVNLGEGMLSAEAIADPPPFERLRTAVLYDDIAAKLVSGLKFSDRIGHARWMANWMAHAGSELLENEPLIVPVPLHRGRLFTRRFNQSAELARQIAHRSRSIDRYEPQILTRTKATKQQVGLSLSERSRNVSGAFRVASHSKMNISGKNIVLVDDVYTTGATAKAATRALKRAGAKNVDVLVFAKVENGTD